MYVCIHVYIYICIYIYTVYVYIWMSCMYVYGNSWGYPTRGYPKMDGLECGIKYWNPYGWMTNVALPILGNLHRLTQKTQIFFRTGNHVFFHIYVDCTMWVCRLSKKEDLWNNGILFKHVKTCLKRESIWNSQERTTLSQGPAHFFTPRFCRVKTIRWHGRELVERKVGTGKPDIK